MRQYAGWQAPFYSFWSKSFYIDVAKNWHGLAYLYLFVLICFTWVFMSIKKEMDFSYVADRASKPLLQQMPTITIDKGILSIDKPSPYTIKATTGEPLITFDASDKPMSADKAPGIFFVTKKTVIFKASQLDKDMAQRYKEQGLTPRSHRVNSPDQDMDLFSTTAHAVIDQTTIQQFINNFKKMVPFIVFIVALPLSFIFCVLQSLIYGLVGMAVASASQVNLTYGTLVRLSTVALTPVLLIDSLLKMRNLDSILWIPTTLIITIAYIIFAVRSNIIDPNQPSNPASY